MVFGTRDCQLGEEMKSQEPMAFPSENDEGKYYNWIEQGMTLRDYFAAKAMQGMMSDRDHQLGAWDNYVDWHKNLTSQAYQIADAMMKAREQ